MRRPGRFMFLLVTAAAVAALTASAIALSRLVGGPLSDESLASPTPTGLTRALCTAHLSPLRFYYRDPHVDRGACSDP